MKGRKAHPHTKAKKMPTAKPTIRLGKEDFESPSPLARHVQTMGVSRAQKKELEHSEGPKRRKMHKKAHR